MKMSLVTCLGILLLSLSSSGISGLGTSVTMTPKNTLKQSIVYNGKSIAGSNFSSLHRFVVKIFDSEYTFRCTGVLIQERFVLFASHCRKNMSKKIVVQLALDDQGKNWEEILALNYTEHSEAKINGDYNYNIDDYEGNKMQDLGMLLLAKKPTWAKPVKVLADSMDELPNYVKYTRLAGYQRNKDFTINETMGYVKFFRAFQMEQSNYLTYVLDEDMGMCRGDSGGPTIITVNNQHFLVGVTSAYRGESFTDLPGSTVESKKKIPLDQCPAELALDNPEQNCFEKIHVAHCSQKAILIHTGRQIDWIRNSMKLLADDKKVETNTKLDAFSLQPLPSI